MKIDRLQLKGILRFDRAVDLDLSTMPAGLVAVCGINGAGKTSLLEAMIAAFYREFPSRGQAIDFATGKDSYLDVTASFGEATLRGRLNLDGVARTSDAVLEGTGALGPVFLNDGKVSTFDAAVAKYLPPFTQLLAAQYAAQNGRGTFKTLDRKGRRDLFASLLGLAQLEGYAATARQSALTVERRLLELRAVVARLEAETTESHIDAISAEGNRLQVDLTAREQTTASLTAWIPPLERAVDDARARVQQSSAAAIRHADAVSQRDIRARDRGRGEERQIQLRAAAERDRQVIERRLVADLAHEEATRDAQPTLEKLDTLLALDVQTLTQRASVQAEERQTRIANNRALLTRASEIRAAAAAVSEGELALGQLRQAAAEADGALQTADRERQALALDLAALGSAEADRDRAIQATLLLARVPFGARCADAGCEFVQSAVDARDRIPRLEARVLERTDLAARAAAADAARTPLVSLLERARATAAEAEHALASLRTLAQDVGHVDAAERRIAELEDELTAIALDRDAALVAAHQVDDERRAHREAVIARHAQRTHELRAQKAQDLQRIEARLADALNDEWRVRDAVTHDLAVLDQTIAALAPAVDGAHLADDALHAAQVALREAQSRLTAETAAGARLEAEIAAFERRRREFQARVEDRDHRREATAVFEAELVEWQALARVFGPDGLPVLEIDAAGPGVSTFANDLLQSCFGGRFTVELVTQEAKAKGGGFKEVFELKVFDGERGGEARDLTDLSGGEQVLVDEALKSAIALFVNQRNVQPLLTAWRDETIGALDSENATRYVAMLRRVHQRGGFHHLFFVSHNAEAAALADAQLFVHDGTAEIVLPPFRRAA
jgi:DNA repair protein SbcC/Rad50